MNFTVIVLKRSGILTQLLYNFIALLPHFYLKMYVERRSIGHYEPQSNKHLPQKERLIIKIEGSWVFDIMKENHGIINFNLLRDK